MFLREFDLSACVEKYNQEYEASYSKEEYSKFPYFSDDALASIKSLIKSINESGVVHLYTKAQIDSVKNKKNDAVRKIKNIEYKNDTEYLNILFNERIVKDKDILRKTKDYLWAEKQKEGLDNDKVWDKLTAMLSDKEKIKVKKLDSVRVFWKNFSDFSTANCKALVEIASSILPQLISHHKEIIKNLWRLTFSMPKAIRESCRNYSEYMIERCEELKKYIAKAMLVKLIILDRTNFLSNSLLSYSIEQIKSIMGDYLEIEDREISTQITRKEFSYFLDYIVRNGESKTKKLFGLLSCFFYSKKSGFSIIYREKTPFLIVPTGLENKIPLRKRWPDFIYRGKNICHSVMTKNQLLFSELVQMPASDDINNSSNIKEIMDILNIINRKEKVLSQLFAEINSEKIVNLPKRFYDARKFLRRYGESLERFAQRIMMARLDVAEKISEYLSNRSIESLIHDELAVFDSLETIFCVVKKYADEDLRGRRQLDSRLLKIKASFSSTLCLINAARIIKNLSKGVFSVSDVKYLIEFIDVSNSDRISKLKKNLALEINEIFIFLSAEMKNGIFFESTDYRVTHVDKVLGLNAVIERLCFNGDLKIINKCINKYLMFYLKLLTKNYQSENNKHQLDFILSSIEEVLIAIGKKIDISNKSISDHVVYLQKIRYEKNWTDLYVEAKPLSAVLECQLLDAKFKKDCDVLEKNILSFIGKDDSLSYKKESVDCFFKTIDYLHDSGLDVDCMGKKLSQYQKSLLGLNGNSAKVVENLIFLGVELKKAKNILSESESTLDSLEKNKFFNELSGKIQILINKNSSSSSLSCLIKSSSGRRLLFQNNEKEINLCSSSITLN